MTDNTQKAAASGIKTERLSVLLVIGAATLAFAIKIAIALNTEGTNDVYFFYEFARNIAHAGLNATYASRQMFNHPPLVGYFLAGIYKLTTSPLLAGTGITFPFLLRLPGIVADFGVVILMLRLRVRWNIPIWALTLLALSPVSIMVSGFHGNTDSVLTLLIVLAALLCVWQQPALAGLALALSCGVKVIPLLLLPVFFFFWQARGRASVFSVAFVGGFIILSLQPLLKSPLLFLNNVLAYGSYWGLWGFSYWLRLTGWSGFSDIDYRRLPLPETIASTILKVIVVVAALLIAWRRRNEDTRGLFASIAYVWLAFLVFSPGVAPQYLVWPMPFLLVLSPPIFAAATIASSCFVFFLYNTIAAGLPWNLAVSTNAIADRWAPWMIWPWFTFIAALWLSYRSSGREGAKLRLLSFSATRAEPS